MINENNDKDGRKLIKILTRDASLIAIESWCKGGNYYFEKYSGLEFPANAFRYKNGAFEFFRDVEGFEINLPKSLALWIKENNQKFKTIRRRMTQSLNHFKEVKNLNYLSVQNALKDLVEVYNLFAEGFIGIIMCHHLPRLNELSINKGQVLLDASLIVQLIEWRKAEGNIFFNDGVETINFLLDNIGLLNNWDTNDLHHLTLKELQESIKTKRLPKKIIEKRKNSTYVYFNNRIFYENGSDSILKDFGCYLSETLPQNTSQIHGSIANKGKAKGIVKIIYNRNQLHNFENSKILVAPMTSPWYVPIMEKAAAIVTDEGGITCHAAIIARELNKPCIIGTKYATKIFKDGDLVEVDANKGIVRKLK